MDVREAVGPLEEGRVCARTSEGSTTVVVFCRRVEMHAVFGEWGWVFVESEHQGKCNGRRVLRSKQGPQVLRR